MGEAKQKRLRHNEIRSGLFSCVYCGGKRRGIEVDHMPPRKMFDLRHRPNGLEFPSCTECNQGSKDVDQIASFIGRIFPNANDIRTKAEHKQLIDTMFFQLP
jgi:hypothetical protein